jgi:hypothetical protein
MRITADSGSAPMAVAAPVDEARMLTFFEMRSPAPTKSCA